LSTASKGFLPPQKSPTAKWGFFVCVLDKLLPFVQGRTVVPKNAVFGMWCFGAALESDDWSLHSKRKFTQKDSFGNKQRFSPSAIAPFFEGG